jgi:hypothetical protein
MTYISQATRRRRHHARTVVACLLALLAFMLALVATASAELTFGTLGSGAGQSERPVGIATDFSDGRVYVADSANNRVDVFDSSGNFLMAFGWGVADGSSHAFQTCTTTCFRGISGSGAGQFEGFSKSIAVDNDPSSLSYHDVYVGIDDDLRVQKFDPEGHFLLMFGGGVDKTTGKNVCTAASGDICGAGAAGSGEGQFNYSEDPISVGPDGVVYVGDSKEVGEEFATHVEEFEPSGAFAGQIPMSPKRLQSIAVDSTGDLYIASGNIRGNAVVSKYDSSGTLLFALGTGEQEQLAVDAADDLFVTQGERQFAVRLITEYDSNGNILRRFGYGAFQCELGGIAADHTAAGDVLVVEEQNGFTTPGICNQVRYLSFPPPGPIAVQGGASAIGNVKATLNANINPEGKPTTYHFEYVDQKNFEESGFSSPATKDTPETSVGSDFTLDLVSSVVSVTPETMYHFRLIATNADGSQATGGTTFTSLAPLEIGGTWSTEVGFDTAILHAEVNPLGLSTTGYFQYVDDATYKASGFADAAEIPDVSDGAGAIGFGSGETEKAGSEALASLASGATYHYRVVAVNSFVTLFGPERTFRTFSSALAPREDCENQVFRVGPSAHLPDCRAFELVSPIDKEGGDASQMGFEARENEVNQSAIDGGRFTYSTYRAFADPHGAPNTSQYLATRDPQKGWLTEAISPPRGIRVLSILESAESEFRAFSPDLCGGWLRGDTDLPLAAEAIEGFSNLYRRDDCDGGGYEALTTLEPSLAGLNTPSGRFKPELQGLSANGGCAIFRANGRLIEEASSATLGVNGGRYQLYEDCGGTQRLVSVLPNASASGLYASAGTGGPFIGTQTNEGRSATVWHAVSENGSRVYWTASSEDDVPGTIYVRDNAERTQSALGASGECVEPEAACTYPVSGTVSGANAQFWDATPDGSEALFTTEDKLYEYDFAKKQSTLIAKGVVGLLGASEDLSRVYLASEEVLDQGATAGEPNLYLEAGGVFTFIATLAHSDTLTGASPPAPLSPYPIRHSARVSPDGLQTVFTSTASLTGYDNTDANSGQADTEIYLYNAGAGDGEGKLLCISCNPTGARPAGAHVAGFGGRLFWAAAVMPTWETQMYPEHPLSEDGKRLFFESTDALVPRDTNGKQDVYEWEAGDKGQCEAMGAELFVESSGGCLSLISSGESPEDSKFLDATPTGSDVFIATASSLLPQDVGQIDVYDARVNGGFPQPVSPATCEGEACQNPPSSPNDLTPGSLTFSGAGNLVSPPPPAAMVSKPKARILTRAQKLSGALKACRAKPRRKRAGCEAQARRKYGAKQKSIPAKARGKIKQTTRNVRRSS